MKTAYDVIIRPIITEQSMEDLVTTENVRGKVKRQGAYPQGRTASWKKAVVKLSADSKNIELFEGMA